MPEIETSARDIVDQYEFLYQIREFRKTFTPIEIIAQNPAAWGIDRDPFESKARQGDFIKDPAKICAAICANRAGKSEAGAIKMLTIALESNISGRIWVLSESFDLQKSGPQEKILEYLKPEMIVHQEYYKGDILKQINILNPQGCLIKVEFKTYEQGVGKLQSAKLLCAWLDEEPPEDIFDEVRTRTVDLGGQMILTFTPLKGLTWSYDAIYNSRKAYISVYNWGMADNPFIPLAEIVIMRETLSPKKAAMRLYGRYQGSEKAIYDVFDRDRNVKPNLFDDRLPCDVCIDWGVAVAAVGIWQEKQQLDSKGKSFTKYVLIDSKELVGLGYGQVMTKIITMGYILRDWFCDPAGRQRSQASRAGKSLLSLIKEEYGIRFKYIPSQSVEEGIEIVSAHMLDASGRSKFEIQSGIVLDPESKTPHTPEQRIEGYVRDDNGDPVKDGVNDHFCDMVRYYITNKVRGGRGVVQH